MRTAGLLLGVMGLLACNAAATPTRLTPPPDGSDYSCSQFCADEMVNNELVGPFADCIDSCCAESVARCEADLGDASVEGGSADSGAPVDGFVPDSASPDGTTGPDAPPPVDSGSDDTGGDDDGCVPCGGQCCPGGESCVQGECQTLCTTGSDCTSSCCAPALDGSGNPVGPYVCKTNNAEAYTCCNGAFNDCSGTFCCVTDTAGNEFCAEPCSGSSSCGTASCNTYSFSATTCSGPTACGPT
jgi:hypothetical protein